MDTRRRWDALSLVYVTFMFACCTTSIVVESVTGEDAYVGPSSQHPESPAAYLFDRTFSHVTLLKAAYVSFFLGYWGASGLMVRELLPGEDLCGIDATERHDDVLSSINIPSSVMSLASVSRSGYYGWLFLVCLPLHQRVSAALHPKPTEFLTDIYNRNSDQFLFCPPGHRPAASSK